MDEQQKKLERLRPQLDLLLSAAVGKANAIIVVSSLAATLLIVATFNSQLLPLTSAVRFLIVILLVLIPVSLFVHLLNMDYAASESKKVIEEIVGKISLKRYWAEEFFAWYPYIAATVFLIVIVSLILMIVGVF